MIIQHTRLDLFLLPSWKILQNRRTNQFFFSHLLKRFYFYYTCTKEVTSLYQVANAIIFVLVCDPKCVFYLGTYYAFQIRFFSGEINQIYLIKPNNISAKNPFYPKLCN